MSKTIYRFLLFISFYFILAVCFISCNQSGLIDYFFSISQTAPLVNPLDENVVNSCNLEVKSRALSATRFKNLEHLKTVVSITYDKDYSKMDSNECRNSVVNLSYISNGEKIIRTLTSGVSQKDLSNLLTADCFTQSRFVLCNSSAVRQRRELDMVNNLSRRRSYMFGPGDVAFYDLAEASFRNINTPNLAYQNPRDSSEKGYINTFNHVTAQAIMTSFFSEDLADLIADLHERYNMPELTSGRFSESQLMDSIDNPVDNYIDIINNEIGQKIGLKLIEKYNLNEKTECTPILFSAYLNDIQSYYMAALEIGLDNFRPTDEVVIKFSKKMNKLLKGPRIYFQ